MSRRLVAAALAVLVLLVLGVLVVGGVFAFRAHAAEQAEDRRHAVLQAARQEALNLTSLSYKTVDSDIQRVLELATGSFRKQWAGHEQALRRLLPEVKAVTRGEVLAAGITKVDQDSATVLLAVDQVVKNAATERARSAAPQGQGGASASGQAQGSGGVLRHYRMQMVLEYDQGRWLVAKLEFVP